MDFMNFWTTLVGVVPCLMKTTGCLVQTLELNLKPRGANFGPQL